MKYIIYLTIIFAFETAKAQTVMQSVTPEVVRDSVRIEMAKASKYLKGYQHPYSPEKAFDLYLKCAALGKPEAMNALGNLYFQGLGTEQNGQKAIAWYENAVQAGYKEAWYNIAIVYKTGSSNVKQDFTKAYQFFMKASEIGMPQGSYYLGYLHYKGLGCEQSYTKAIKYFRDSENYTPSKYMLGLCYKNGYGVKYDPKMADSLLKIAAGFEFRYAEEELTKSPENPENTKISSNKSKTAAYSPTLFRHVKHQVNNNQIEGVYSGNMVIYDWSGSHIIKKMPLKLELNIKNNLLYGTWTESDSLTAILEAKLTDTLLVFTKGNYGHTDHYYQSHSLTWKFENAGVEVVEQDNTVYLAGNVQFYNEDLLEPEKPVYISLTKQNSQTKKSSALTCKCLCGNNCTCTKCNCDKNKTEPNKNEKIDKSVISGILAFPNPYSDQLNISFDLGTMSDVTIQMFNNKGNKVYQTTYKNLTTGRHTKALEIGLPVGIYIVNILCKDIKETTIVVKQ